MSRANTVQRKPTCKVCYDAGKTESEYTSHWVKDLTGKTICPTLLNTECRYCFKVGHTAKFCGVLAKNNKEKVRSENKEKNILKSKIPVEIKKKPVNGFAALESDTEEETDEEDPFITSCKNGNLELAKKLFESKAVESEKAQETKLNWATIAAKPKAMPIVEVSRPSGLVLLSDYIKKPATENTKPVQKKSWADLSDSEDEEIELPDVNFAREIADDTW